MFERMKGWWRGVKNWVVDLLHLQSHITVDLAVSGPMSQAISLWMNMYTGNAPWLTDDIVSMNLPSFVAAEISRLTTIEMVSEVSGSKRADYLNEPYSAVVNDARLFTEYAAAGGSLALKPYIIEDGIVVDYVKAGRFFPLSFDASGRVTGCLFLDRITKGDKVYTRVESHTMEPGGCRIQNSAYEGNTDTGELGKPVPLDTVEEWAGLTEDALIQGVDRPLFAVLRMPFANTIDPGSPLGVSVYSRATDLIREADKQFSRLLWEMESGNRAMYVDLRAFQNDDAEPGPLPFKKFYRMCDVDPTTQGDLFKEWSPPLRVQEQVHALNEILQKIEDACGIARGSISEAPESSAGGLKTATELKIMRQRTYATIRDTQKAVETALRDLLAAMDTWATIGGLAPEGDYDVSFEFDDSVVTDRSTEFLERMQLLTARAMAPWELRAWYMGETEDQAKANLPAQEPSYFSGLD